MKGVVISYRLRYIIEGWVIFWMSTSHCNYFLQETYTDYSTEICILAITIAIFIFTDIILIKMF